MDPVSNPAGCGLHLRQCGFGVGETARRSGGNGNKKGFSPAEPQGTSSDYLLKFTSIA
ncbi:hypothetical protein HL670_01223 [Serratia plymuthica]|nr:hypothetical protein HL670_01223 [Serratia plymuthica]